MHRAHAVSKCIQKSYDELWNKSYTSSLCSTRLAGNPDATRRRRLVPKKVVHAACSGAAAEIYKDLMLRAQEVRLEPVKPESRTHPWLPSISKGAVSMIESFLCAYAQEAVSDAWAVSEHAIGAKRLSEETMAMGLSNVNKRIFLTDCRLRSVPRKPIKCLQPRAIAVD
jgi:hypothetical protein